MNLATKNGTEIVDLHRSGGPVGELIPLTVGRISDAEARRLLLAAPDLLAALRAIVAAWESVPEGEFVPDCINVDSLWEEARKAIRSAE